MFTKKVAKPSLFISTKANSRSALIFSPWCHQQLRQYSQSNDSSLVIWVEQPEIIPNKNMPTNGTHPFTERFPTVFDLDGEYQSGAKPKCLAELQLMQLSSCVREKKGWTEKLLNPELKTKWMQEMKAQGNPTILFH